jgi:integrase
MRRQNGLYRRAYGILNFRYRDRDGVWREKSTGTTDRAEALKFKQQWDEDNKNDALPGDKAQWTVEQACTKWVDQHTARLKTARAKSNERSLLRQLIRFLGAKKLKAVTLDDLKDYQLKRSERVRGRTINLELRILVNVLHEQNLWKRLSEHYERLTESDGEIGRALTLEELSRLDRTASTNDRWNVAYYAEILAANSGMRGGEIRKLPLGAIDLENRRIRIPRKATKTKAGARIVELNSAALAAVSRLYRRAELLGATSPDHFLLPADLSKHTKSSDPLRGGRGFDVTQHQQGWRTAWRNLCEAADLKGVRFHDLRHSFVTVMAERGVPLPVVQSMVGHMSAAMTRHYTHISTNAARSAVELLEKMRPEPHFVDEFVDVASVADSNLLN